MRPSSPLFDALAHEYDEHFRVPHRALYDELAWEYVEQSLPQRAGLIIDAGCGSGRWAARLTSAGHRVIGIEQSPRMAEVARARDLGPDFDLIEGPMEAVDLDAHGDVVLAMGSIQYTADPDAMIARMACWAAPGGHVLVLVDSLVALVLEQLRDGRSDEAILSLSSRRGTWREADQEADLHLLTAAQLERAFLNAGLDDVTAHGLLVGASALGREALGAALRADREGQLGLERELSGHPLLADLGKQLLVRGAKRRERLT